MIHQLLVQNNKYIKKATSYEHRKNLIDVSFTLITKACLLEQMEKKA